MPDEVLDLHGVPVKPIKTANHPYPSQRAGYKRPDRHGKKRVSIHLTEQDHAALVMVGQLKGEPIERVVRKALMSAIDKQLKKQFKEAATSESMRNTTRPKPRLATPANTPHATL